MDFNAIALELERRAATCRLSNGEHLVAYDHVPDAVTSPAFMVAEMDVDYAKTFRGMAQAMITCRVMVAREDDQYGQRRLREFMGMGGMASVRDALLLKPRYVAGVWDDLNVQRARGNRLFIYGTKRLYGVELDVFVIGSGS